MMRTALTRLLGVKIPIIAPPMAGPSGGALAAQVSRAGAFGFLQAGYDTEATFRHELDIAKATLQGNIDTPALASAETQSAHADGSFDSHALNIGAGFIGWKLDEPDGKAAALLPIALDARVKAVWFSFGEDLGKWVRYVRSYDEQRHRDRDQGKGSSPHKTVAFVLVNTLEEAKTAVERWDVDVLVAQGIEAGGHGHASAPPLLNFLPEVTNYLRASGRTVTVLGAGGLANGSQIAAVLAMGAAGAVLGTRFLCTPEARYTAGQKKALCAASGAEATLRTMGFDMLRRATGWPAGVDGRALRNETIERLESGEDEAAVREFFRKKTSEDDPHGMLVWSGTGVGLVNEIKPAADVVAELHRELIDALRAASNILSD